MNEQGSSVGGAAGRNTARPAMIDSALCWSKLTEPELLTLQMGFPERHQSVRPLRQKRNQKNTSATLDDLIGIYSRCIYIKQSQYTCRHGPYQASCRILPFAF